MYDYTVRYYDINCEIKLMSSETLIVPHGIKAIWEEADKKKISIEKIVETVREVRKIVYGEEY